jgi:hypothetical protein
MLKAFAKSRWTRLGLGIALSGGALSLALSRTSLGEIGAVLARVSWPWVGLALVLKVATLVIKDLRWRCELEAMAPGPYRRTFPCIGLGYFGNIVLPFKLGELLRVSLLRRHNPGVSFGDALATIAAERALDGAVLAVMVGVALQWTVVPTWVLTGTLLLLAVMLGVILVSVLTPLHDLLLRLLPPRGLLGWGRRVVEALSRGTAVLRKGPAVALATAYTALAWLVEALVFFTAVHALAVPLDFSAILVVTLLLSVGLLIPSAPGQIGTHQALSVLFLAPFGIDSTTAVSLSFLQQAISLATLGSIGGFVLIREAAARELVRQGSDLASAVPAAGIPPSVPPADPAEPTADR